MSAVQTRVLSRSYDEQKKKVRGSSEVHKRQEHGTAIAFISIEVV